jgi:putative hydrolase of the HAD superfamily
VGQAVILTDADNTLWDTDAVFADAQLWLLDAIERTTGLAATAAVDERLTWVRKYDQAIAKMDHRRLRYPPSLLVRALAMGLARAAPADAASVFVRGGNEKRLDGDSVQAITAVFLEAIERVPEILPGVRQGLEAAQLEGIDVWVLTEGPANRQRAIIATHGLNGLVRGVSEVTKSKEQFARHQRRFAPRTLYVIGDQPDRDVAPGRAAGCRAVLVPSRFKPEWQAAWHGADRVTETFDTAVDWVLADVSGDAAAGRGQVNPGYTVEYGRCSL